LTPEETSRAGNEALRDIRPPHYADIDPADQDYVIARAKTLPAPRRSARVSEDTMLAALVKGSGPVTETIDRIVTNVPGWTPPDQLLALHEMAVITAPLGGDIIEIGSWCGRSAAVLGHAVATTGVGQVWAIDLFPRATDWRTNADGTHSFSVDVASETVGGYEDQTIWDEPFRRDIAPVYARCDSVLDAFNATIAAEGLERTVTAFRGTGTMFANQAAAGLKARLVFVDGDHSYGAVCADIAAMEKLLVPGGWIGFDDAFTCYEGVSAAIRGRILGAGRYQYAHQVTRKLFVAQLKQVRSAAP
jgi:Methyltransferase domain